MVLLTYCIPCRSGRHERCQGVMQAVPEGMMGGVRCRCKGECQQQSHARPCPCCEGRGCEECGGTGQRVSTHIDAGDGLTAHVTGNAPLSPETEAALAALMRAAASQMEADADA